MSSITAPEARLLLLTAARSANDDTIRTASAGVVDWARVVNLARLERAVPVIYPRLRSVAADLVPAHVMDQMRRLALVSEFAMLHLESRLRESLDALERARVRVMLLKGAGLAYSVYGDVRKRPMSDIDMLVDPSDARTARCAMLDAGWREVATGLPDAVYEHHHHLPPLVDDRSPQLALEIHTALFPQRQPFALGVNELWSRARPLSGTARGAFAPDSVHSLLYACLHFLWSHEAHFGVWRTIRDVDAISACADMDWDAFVAVARGARAHTSCYWTLRIAQSAAGVDVPARVLDELRPRRSAYLMRAIERHFLTNLFPAEGACPSVKLHQALWELGVMPRRSGHGDIRPWDSDNDFVLPREATNSPRVTARVARILASPAYIRSLMGSGG